LLPTAPCLPYTGHHTPTAAGHRGLLAKQERSVSMCNGERQQTVEDSRITASGARP